VSARARIAFTLNGRRQSVEAPPMKRLLDVLREDCGLPGTKEGCGEGECGACSVLIDGRSVCSCLVPAIQVNGATVVTVEGLARGPRLNALQQSFLDAGGAQCGICTPGMLITAMELLSRNPGRVPSDVQIREALAGNLCRCTGYQKIVDAVRAAARVGRATSKAGARSRAPRTGSGRGARPKGSTSGSAPRSKARSRATR
jgi:aerobic carbon-monoxide dehydrogenase small subunit